MLFYDKDLPFVIKLYSIPTNVLIEFMTAAIGLIIVIIPSWAWGINYIKKQIRRKEGIQREKKDIIEKINNIDNTVSHIDSKLKEFIAKDQSELRLSEKATFICSESGLCIDANPALCDLFGATRDQMLGYGWTDYIVKEDRDRAIKHWESAIEKNINIRDDYRIDRGLSGDIIEIYYNAVISRDDSGKIYHILGQVFKK